MELTELESILKGYDEKIDKNISINRDILKKLIIDKPSKYIQTERLKALYQLCSPLLLAILLAIIIDFTNISVSATLNFYIGLVLFIPPFIFIWSLNIKHFLIIRKINLSGPVIHIKKQIAELERYSIWMTKIRNILMPLPISGMLLIFLPHNIYQIEFILMLALIISIFIISSLYRNQSVRERYRKLKSEIEEFEALEK